jgi:hypothetical protein
VIGYAGSAHPADDVGAEALRAFGVDRLLCGIPFPELVAIATSLDGGDVVVTPSLDHLGASMWKVFDLLDDLRARGVGFVSMAEGVDTREERVSAALDIMRSVLSAERRLVARRSAEARARPVEVAPSHDPQLERSRRVAASWIEDVREHRPRLTWNELVDHVERSGREGEALTASLMRRHVRRLVEAGDLPGSVLERAQRRAEEDAGRAARRARELVAEDPSRSLRDIGTALEAEGIRPPRAEAWSAQTVKRLLD